MNDGILGFSRETFAILLTSLLIVATTLSFGATVGACDVERVDARPLRGDR